MNNEPTNPTDENIPHQILWHDIYDKLILQVPFEKSSDIAADQTVVSTYSFETEDAQNTLFFSFADRVLVSAGLANVNIEEYGNVFKYLINVGLDDSPYLLFTEPFTWTSKSQEEKIAENTLNALARQISIDTWYLSESSRQNPN